MDKEREYVKKAQLGDEESFRKLYHHYYQKAFYIALKISNYCEADAQDIVQDTFMEIHRSLKNLQNPEHFKAWMIRILISKSSHKFRDNRDMFVEPEKLMKMEGYREQRNYMLPGNQLNNDEDKQILLQMMNQLKPKQREVLVLQYFEHLSIKEMAEILQIPEGTVKTRILYAKNQLKELVSEYEKKEGRRLGFQADTMFAALALALANEFMAFAKPKAVFLPKQLWKNHSTWVYAAGAAVCTAVLVSAVRLPLWNRTEPMPANYSAPERQFRTVSYRDNQIENCRDAYYTLKEWAQNPQRMALRGQQEVMEISEVYAALKEYQGAYYEKLVLDAWADAFESRSK
ncbi:MAG: sigma-70 family RNA polymerase sigma factor [Erysipelotrichaceae bacterium]|nr:sigma-70 family RNA polymerase sigma factor [Erysipelotrichaceae bacterium]MCI9313203.1 sigma-70 family RNA polymerase sigma factor [Erysipelotrichaceae bacterium]